MRLSVRIQKAKSTTGQAGHDLTERPGYALSEKHHLNQIVYGGSADQINARITDQKNSIIKTHNEYVQQKKAGVKDRRFGGWRKNTATHQSAIITFDKEFRANQANINKSKLDQCALNFFNDFCELNNAELTYIVRHEDEATPHYHAMFTNYNNSLMRPHRFAKKDTSAMQDLAGIHFDELGIKRGIKRDERLEITRENTPKRGINESERDYENRIYKTANVIHRSVSQLHFDLPHEIDALEIQLKETEADKFLLEQEIQKNQERITRTKGQLRELLGQEAAGDDAIGMLISKLDNRVNRYGDRLAIGEAKLKKMDEIIAKYQRQGKALFERNRNLSPRSVVERLDQLEAEKESFAPDREKLKALEHENALLKNEIALKNQENTNGQVATKKY